MNQQIKEFYDLLWLATGSQNWSKFIIVLIFLFALLIIPLIISFIFPLFKSRLNSRSKVLLYAFTTGFFIVMSTFGFIRESLEISSINAAIIIPNDPSFTEHRDLYIYLYNVFLVGGGVLFGVVFAYFVKYVISYRINKALMSNKKTRVFIHEHSDEQGHTHTHKHDDYIFNREDSNEIAEKTLIDKVEAKLKIIALILLLTHRIPEGLLLGYNLNLLVQNRSNSLSVAFIISLILHLIPEELVFYYRLRDGGYSKWNSLLISFLGLMLFFPFMLIGIYSGDIINQNWEIRSIIFSTIGGIFLFTSLVEFFPEFYHTDTDKKTWLSVITCLFIGVIFAVIILSIHKH